MDFPKDLEFCVSGSSNACLKCSSETGKRPFDCKKYFGSDHLKLKRYKRFKCKSKRIRLLAQPKSFTPKYVKYEEPPATKSIEISRDFILPTRIKMLAVPKVRKLVSSYEQYRNIVERERLCNINNLIGNSMMTMYSRLANVHLPCPKPCIPKWTAADWKRHCEWLKKRACPKKEVRLPKEPPKKIVPLKDLQVSMYRLSQPRQYREKYRPTYGFQSVVKESSKLYMPTQRIMKLAEPKKVHLPEDFEEEIEEGTFFASPNALTYKPSDRITELANPKPLPKQKAVDIPEVTQFGVIVRALKASPSERTLELAKPKLKDDDDDEEKPLVNPKALKAKPTPRILELSQPRVYPQ